MRWLFDWIFGDLLYRHRDSLRFAVSKDAFVAWFPKGVVQIRRIRSDLVVTVREGSTSFFGIFSGDGAQNLWDLTLRHVDTIRGWKGVAEVSGSPR